ncbi:pilus assembly protein TadG-related protein [Sinorhizobium sp. 8-89]|uniref:TadE/TadG family type IV pilus assembly protein n=1 Tax=Sinorhizobium sp. 7-81 TaxID=3049087 RepID=UPI0024C3E1D8|nr:pilus assembly protein TadG-related protein [Sinorhizobium sp. 7-81]MDK1389205.1 pilus assembly protein TadG-related protein [Sinorhizobium sp. 7-81]
MLNGAIKRFWDDHRGYVIVLTLISMPLLLGLSLLVIDVGRTGNLHTDLQNAVDAMALAGARELDGRDDAIDRADAAIETLTNGAAFSGGGTGMSLGSHITVVYDAGNDAGSTVSVTYLKEIPADDDDPITAAMVTTDPHEASYARVVAKDHAMTTIFPIPVGLNRDTINVSAEAVAVYRASACDVTPIYICNPFEDPSGNNGAAAAEALHTNFAAGALYGVQIELHSTSSSSPGPGNFGFLATYGNGANVLAEALATGSPGVCYERDALETKTGANAGPVEAGLNTRFGLYSGSFGNARNDGRYRPARNVRSAQSQTGGANKICGDYNPVMSGSTVGDTAQAVPLGYGAAMSSLTGGKISTGNNWQYGTYWGVAHDGIATPTISDILSNYSSYPSPAGSPSQPSAYDVYRYELANPARIGDASENGETGTPLTGGQCYSGPDLSNYTASEYGDRREIFAAVVNCKEEYNAGRLTGHSVDTRAIAFARMFLTKPAIADSGERYLSMEMIDITGRGGRGTLDEFLREEAELVR